MSNRKDYYEHAYKLHMENPVVDAHLDLPAEIYLRHVKGEREVIKTRFLDNWKKAGINVVVGAVFIETKDLPERGYPLV